jgi:dienelactone hydrolase
MKSFFVISILFFVFSLKANSDTVSTHYLKSDTTISFALYTPTGSAEDIRTMPVFFFFEPWGNGAYPVSIYSDLAKRYNFVLIGFNASRNGVPFEESAAKFNLAFSALQNEYGLDPSKLCIVGFSGAGKVALNTIASQKTIHYVIYGGATMDAALAGKEVLGFAGTKDMNYTDLLDYDKSLNIKTDVRHFIVEYDGPHAWFDTATMENAFVWMKLNLMRTNVLPRDTSFIKTIALKFMSETDSLISAHKVTKAISQIQKSKHFLYSLYPIVWFDEKLSGIEKSISYKKEKKYADRILEEERQTKKNYEDYFFTKDMEWWKAEIDRLKLNGTDMQTLSNRRLFGFIGLNCYYTGTDALEQNNLKVAEAILDIYRYAFPKSAESNFLSAVLWAKKNDLAKSNAYFAEAKKSGFTEWDNNSEETILQYFRRRPLK